MKWIFSYNLIDFFLDEAIHELPGIDWAIQNYKVLEGDEVYLYSSAPERSIFYKCIVVKSNKAETTIDDSNYKGNPAGTKGRWAELKLELEFNKPGITYSELREHGLKQGTLTKRKINDGRLLQFISDFESNPENIFTGEYVPPNEPFYWMISPGEDAYMWEAFYKDGIAAIDWHRVDTGDLRNYKSRKELEALGLGMNDSLCLWQFCNEIFPGDVIFAKKGLHQLIGVGIVQESYYYEESDEYMKLNLDDKHAGNYRHRIKVNWEPFQPVTVQETLPRKTLTLLKNIEKIDYYLSLFGIESANENEETGNSNEEAEIENVNHIEGIEKEILVKARINQSVFKERLLKKYGKCCLCGMSNQKLLIASHIKPWAKSDAIEKTDISNGLLLCPNHDKLFDSGLISFNSDGSIIVSKMLSKKDCMLLNVDDRQRITVDEKMNSYLEYHRNSIFKETDKD